MTKKTIYNLFFVGSAVFLIAWITVTVRQIDNFGGWLLMLFFLSLAVAIRGNRLLKGLSFTLIIFATVSVALYHPGYFQQWWGLDLRELIIPLIQLIMFGMGTEMSLKDFAGVFKSPKGVVIGVVSHFIIMPLLGFTLASITNFPPEIAAGIILIGCSPSGLASNVMAYLARANLALSVTITAISTLIAPFATPLLMKLLAGALVEIDVLKMMWEIIKMIILPIGAGLVFNKLLSGKSQWLDKAMPLLSMFGIAFILTIMVAAGRENLLTMGLALIGVVLVHNLFGYFLGYWSGRAFKLPEADCRTIAIEVGMQNAGLATGIARAMGKLATVGLAAAVFGPLMNITGSALASWWHNRLPKEDAPGNKKTADYKKMPKPDVL
jgi:bile acid:Na+ symporter, BASS family